MSQFADDNEYMKHMLEARGLYEKGEFDASLARYKQVALRIGTEKPRWLLQLNVAVVIVHRMMADFPSAVKKLDEALVIARKLIIIIIIKLMHRSFNLSLSLRSTRVHPRSH
jgi:hypothetical protein